MRHLAHDLEAPLPEPFKGGVETDEHRSQYDWSDRNRPERHYRTSGAISYPVQGHGRIQTSASNDMTGARLSRRGTKT